MNASKTPVVALTLTIDGVAIANFPASAINLDGLATLASNPIAAQAVAEAFAPTEAAPAPVPTTQDLVNFLRSDPRYEKRTPKAIQKFFDGYDEEFLKNLTGQAIAEGKVKRHLAYGSSIYSALAPALYAPTVPVSVPVPAEAEAEAQPVSVVNLIDFLRSDSRYTQRSESAIVTKFGPVVADSLLQAARTYGYIENMGGRDQNFYAITGHGNVTFPAIPVLADTSAPDLEPEAVLNFLRSDPQYTKRSFEAVANHFTGTPETTLVGILSGLSNAGRVSITNRRSDGDELYSATTSASAPTLDTPSDDSITDFLRSDNRYASRSFDAIQRHFNADPVDLELVLSNLVDEGEITRLNRRRDGAALYSVA